VSEENQKSCVPFGIVVLMAILWLAFGGQIVAHEEPYFPPPKKIAFGVSALLISVLLFSTGTRGRGLGCATLFVVFAVFVLGAMWTRG
jgi:hypothetical protein